MKVKLRQVIALLLVLGVVIGGVASCSAESKPSFNIDSISSYRGIPGVTEDEITAIEALKSAGRSFSYGSLRTKEAFVLPNGELAGFTPMFCGLLSELFGIPFVHRLYSWYSLKSGIDARAVDFTGDLIPTPERKLSYFMTYPIAERSLRILTHGDSHIKTESDLNGLRVGFPEEDVIAQSVLEIYPELSFEIVNAQDAGDAFGMLRSGFIDAFVDHTLEPYSYSAYPLVNSQVFFPLVYAPVSMATANPELEPVISVVNKYIYAGGIDRLHELYRKGDTEYAKHEFGRSLSAEEAAYIAGLAASGSKVRIALEHDNYPISFYDENYKKFDGIAPDILAEISKLTGIEFEAATDKNTTFPEILERLRTGDVALISELTHTEEREKEFIWVDAPYSTFHYAILSKADYPDLEIYQVIRASVGVVKGTSAEVMFDAWFPNHTDAKRYNTQNEALDALELGEIDLFMTVDFILLFQMNYREKPGYKVNVVFAAPIGESRFGLNKDQEILRSIIGKAQSHVDTEKIVKSWTSRVYDYSRKFEQERFLYMTVLAGTLTLSLAILMVLYLKDAQKSRTIAEQSATLAAIYNSMPAMVYTKDFNGLYTSCNRRFEEELEISESEIIGRAFHDMDTRDSSADRDFSEIDRKVLSESVTVTTEGWYVFAGKHRRAKEIIRTPLIQNGKVAGLLGITMDITKRKLAEEAANEAHERAKTMLDTIPLCCCLVSRNYECIDCNSEAVRLFELNSKQEFIDNFAVLSPELQPDGRSSMEVACAIVDKAFEGERFVGEWTHQLLDGTPIPAITTYERVNYGGDYAVLSYARDMREHKRMTATIEAIMNNLPGMVFQCLYNPPEYTYTFVSQGCLELLGYAPEELTRGSAVRFFDLVHPDDVDALKKLSAETYPMGLPFEATFRVITKDGAVKWVWERSRVIEKKPDGTPCLLEGYHTDITEQRRLESAEMANRAKTQFLATMSHEIRTPMNAILGITEILHQDETLVPHIREALGKIYNSGEMLLALINDILDMSKIEAGKLELTPGEYKVASLLNDTTTLNMMRIGSKPIEFELHVDENTPSELIGDEIRIKQILNNLLSNAFKYTERGVVKLSVSSETRNGETEPEESEVTLVFRVSDTGQGMTEEQVSRMFEEYSRFNTEANRMTEGTGLGMGITRNLVRLMNGEVTVKSELNMGTIFIVRLPQKATGEGALGRELAESLRNFRMNGSKQIRRAQVVFEPMPYGSALVVDDVESNLYVVKGLLAPYELSVDAVMCGFDAVEKIKGGKEYDIVFMDHMMPGMDGIEATKIIRGLGYKLPIVALTANALVGQADMFLANGFDGFISKPIDVRQLNAALKKFIRDKQPPEVIEAARLRGGARRGRHAEDAERPAVTPQLAGIFIRDAEKAAAALAEIHERGSYDEEDIRMYTISVHAMKSAFANVGETELSDVAGKLEQAGRDKDTAVMLSETGAFLSGLRAVVEKLAELTKLAKLAQLAKLAKNMGSGGDAAEYDREYLREKLFAVREACETYDKKSAKAALSDLGQKEWPRRIEELLDTLSEHLLNGDFEEVSKAADLEGLE
ncbi:MAG: transporter substrate-binding domain-containing protein [Synergistaceae bacterium]|nr:transporter substrate-binding domain-containing protein [Synergistaceae bacterium]